MSLPKLGYEKTMASILLFLSLVFGLRADRVNRQLDLNWVGIFRDNYDREREGCRT